MPILVEYRCPDCDWRTDRWASHPLPPLADCARCARPARRQFGGALLARSASPSAHPVPERAGDGCGDGVPGTCTLIPTAARMLSARARGDNRALDREIAHQESAIKAGTLDPSGPVTTMFTGGPPATR